MSADLFSYDLLRERKLRALKTISRADYLVKDLENTLVRRLGVTTSTLKKVLVVGCPGGVVQNYLREQGVDFDVFDPLLEADFKDHKFPFKDSLYDAVVEGFLFHWINEPLMFLAETHRVLRPGGMYLSGFLGGTTLGELRQALLETDIALYEGAYARISPMIKPEAATRILQTVGFKDPIVDHEEIGVGYPGLKNLVQDLRFMGESNALKDQRSPKISKGYMDKAQEHYQKTFPTPDQSLVATFDFVFMTGWRSL